MEEKKIVCSLSGGRGREGPQNKEEEETRRENSRKGMSAFHAFSLLFIIMTVLSFSSLVKSVGLVNKSGVQPFCHD
jgi:hypothetical protein